MRRICEISYMVAATAVLSLVACAGPNTKLPQNPVVSTTLCADGYVQAFPEIEPRLAALSWQSQSLLSQTPQRLRSLPQTDDDQERRLKWSAAIQVSSAGGHGDIDLKWGEDFETVWANLALLSETLEIPDPSGALQSRLQSIEKPRMSSRILYLDRSGATAGPGTFVDAVIKAAGGTNIIQNPGWQSPDTESLIALKPDIILTSFMDSNYAGINDRLLRQAALASMVRSLPSIDIPGSYWPCAGPGLVGAAERLNHALLNRTATNQ